MGGLIAALGLLIAKKFGLAVSGAAAVSAGFAVAAATFAALTPAVREKIRHVCCDLDWAEEVCRGYNAIPRLYRKSFWQLFGFCSIPSTLCGATATGRRCVLPSTRRRA